MSFLLLGFTFRVMNAPLALDLAFGTLCEQLQQWGQTHAGIPVLLGWLLGDSDPRGGLQTSTPVSDTRCCPIAGLLCFCRPVVGWNRIVEWTDGHYSNINCITIKNKK